jgi:hypothetical protein
MIKVRTTKPSPAIVWIFEALASRKHRTQRVGRKEVPDIRQPPVETVRRSCRTALRAYRYI